MWRGQLQRFFQERYSPRRKRRASEPRGRGVHIRRCKRSSCRLERLVPDLTGVHHVNLHASHLLELLPTLPIFWSLSTLPKSLHG